jgi:hypothetical protein
MMTDDSIMICVIAVIACFCIWVFTPHFRRTMAAADAQEKSQAKAELDLDQLRHEQAQKFERERLALEAESERMRLELEAERAKLEAELGVSLKKEPEVVYIKKEVPVMVGQEVQPQQTESLGKGVAKTAVKSAAAFAGGYAIGRKLF